MKKLLPILLLALLGAGCSEYSLKDTEAAIAKASGPAPSPHDWFIESYDHELVTIWHDGLTYTARCNHRGLYSRPICTNVLDLVGKSVLPVEHASSEPAMFKTSDLLVLQTPGDDTVAMFESFEIVSVQKSRLK